jgi:hypothetical protein
MSDQPQFISRADAIEKLAQHYCEAIFDYVRGGLPGPNTRRDWTDELQRLTTLARIYATEPAAVKPRRNYEIEGDLHEACGGRWIISAWCPHNGVHCAWYDFASPEALEQAATNIDNYREALPRNCIAKQQAKANAAALRTEAQKRRDARDQTNEG